MKNPCWHPRSIRYPVPGKLSALNPVHQAIPSPQVGYSIVEWCPTCEATLSDHYLDDAMTDKLRRLSRELGRENT